MRKTASTKAQKEMWDNFYEMIEEEENEYERNRERDEEWENRDPDEREDIDGD